MSGDRADAESEHGRYRRIVAAAGIRPDVDLSSEAQVVLAWLARQDGSVADGIVEIVGAASEVARQAPPWEASPQRMGAGEFGGDPGHSGVAGRPRSPEGYAPAPVTASASRPASGGDVPAIPTR